MNLKINKKVAIVMAVLILSLAMASTAFAADNYKNFKAWVGDMKIFHNGTQVQLKDKPLIINDTTYLPVRSVSEMLGMDVTWDQANKHVGINDKPGTSYNDMLNKFIVQEIKIVDLEAKVKDLEAKLKVKVEEETKVTSLTDMEKQLNKDHNRYNSVDFDIRLYGTKDNVEVRVYVDSSRYNYSWDSMTSTQKERYIQDIVNDILKEFKSSKVSGYVEDNTSYGRLTTFTVSSRGTVSLDNRYNDNTYYGDLEKYLNENYAYYNSNGIRNIKVSESRDTVFLTIEVDSAYWGKTYPSKNQEVLIEQMASYIVGSYNSTNNYYRYLDVTGVIKDYNGGYMYDFNFNTYGTIIVN